MQIVRYIVFLHRVSFFYACRWLVGCMELIVPHEIFHSYGDVTIADEGLQILTYARHLWPLSSESS